ncbi:MAG: hypothetical protein IAE91_09720 [Ignavibacteriaceae bacterium]|nr:hypothetical protein [Ignavibacteriaceae bacterium]
MYNKQELEAMLYAFSLGCLDKDDFINLMDYFQTGEDYLWQDLGEYQNLSCLLASFLDFKQPPATVLDSLVAKYGISANISFKSSSREETKPQPPQVNLSQPDAVTPPPPVAPKSSRMTVLDHFNVDAPQSGEDEDEDDIFVPETVGRSSSRPSTDEQRRPAENGRPESSIRPGMNTQAEVRSGDNAGKKLGRMPWEEPAEGESDIKNDDDFSFEQDPHSVLTPEEQEAISPPINFQTAATTPGDIFEISEPEPEKPVINSARAKRKQLLNAEVVLSQETINEVNSAPVLEYHEPPQDFVRGDVREKGKFFTPEPEPESQVAQPTYYPQQPPPPPQIIERIVEVNNAKNTGISQGLFWGVTSAIVLILCLLIVVFFLDMTETKQMVNKKVDELNIAINANQNLRNTVSINQDLLFFLSNSGTIGVANLFGTIDHPDAAGKFFYNPVAKDGYLQLGGLFTFDTNKGFQLWMKSDGKITKLGEVVLVTQNLQFFKIKNLPDLNIPMKADLFVTEEPVTGSLNPSQIVCLTGMLITQ